MGGPGGGRSPGHSRAGLSSRAAGGPSCLGGRRIFRERRRRTSLDESSGGVGRHLSAQRGGGSRKSGSCGGFRCLRPTFRLHSGTVGRSAVSSCGRRELGAGLPRMAGPTGHDRCPPEGGVRRRIAMGRRREGNPPEPGRRRTLDRGGCLPNAAAIAAGFRGSGLSVSIREMSSKEALMPELPHWNSAQARRRRGVSEMLHAVPPAHEPLMSFWKASSSMVSTSCLLASPSLVSPGSDPTTR